MKTFQFRVSISNPLVVEPIDLFVNVLGVSLIDARAYLLNSLENNFPSDTLVLSCELVSESESEE